MYRTLKKLLLKLKKNSELIEHEVAENVQNVKKKKKQPLF